VSSDVGDSLDQAALREEQDREALIARARADAQLRAGKAGDCDECGEWHSRLVDGACPACRVKYRGEK